MQSGRALGAAGCDQPDEREDQAGGHPPAAAGGRDRAAPRVPAAAQVPRPRAAAAADTGQGTLPGATVTEAREIDFIIPLSILLKLI